MLVFKALLSIEQNVNNILITLGCLHTGRGNHT